MATLPRPAQLDHVDQTLQEWRRTPFIYGYSDCMLSIGRYIAKIGGVDVTETFIGKYDDHEGALAMMASYGGFSGLLTMAGARQAFGPPERGDIVGLSYGDGDTIGGICTGGFIAARLERGVIEVSRKVTRFGSVWRVPHGRM